MKTRTRLAALGIALLLAAAPFAIDSSRAQNASEKNNADKDDPALVRTRKQVQMLDDLYKTAVVLITEHYVNTDADLPAGTAAKALFAAMKKKGWHEVRLLDASGEPIMKSNSPADDFEKEAIKQLLAGKTGYEQVIEKDKKRYLRSATAVPVVMKKCIMCHPNYENVKADQPIGALSYTIPIE